MTNTPVPPHDLEAERSLIGAAFLSPRTIDDAREIICSGDFYRQSHEQLWDAVCDMRDRGLQIDVISVSDFIGADRLDVMFGEDAGSSRGRVQLLELAGSAVTTAHTKRYAEIVRDKSKLRSLIRISTTMAARAYEATGDDNPDDLITEAMGQIMGLALQSKRGAVSLDQAIGDLIGEVLKGKREHISPPHLPWLHLLPGALVVLAAGTSVGKTMFSLDWADEWSKTMPVAYFEYEMNETSLAARIIAKYAQISMADIEDGLEKDQVKTLVDAAEIIEGRKLYVEAMRSDGTGALFAKIRRAATMGCRVVFVDHMGLVPIKVPKGMNHAKAVGMELTNKLKRLALELNIVIVLLAQLNREGQKRSGKDRHPTLQDLRDSGEIEQDADVVVMLYREARAADDFAASVTAREEVGLDGEWPHDLMWMGVRKNRNGPLGHHYVGAIPGHNLLFDYTQTDPYEDVRHYLNYLKKRREDANVQEQLV